MLIYWVCSAHMDLEQEKANNYISLSDLAAKYGYTEYHIRRLARSGRIQAVRYGTKGEWRVDEKSLEKYHQETTQRRFGELQKEQTPSTVLLLAPLDNVKSRGDRVALRDKSSLNAEVRRDANIASKEVHSAKFIQRKFDGINAIPKKFLFIVGGILF